MPTFHINPNVAYFAEHNGIDIVDPGYMIREDEVAEAVRVAHGEWVLMANGREISPAHLNQWDAMRLLADLDDEHEVAELAAA